ncbi:MAG TPA: hypothetical protein GX396_02750 [Tissierellia bacterium]|nr:hypothetical protein [Tissierellia bacterium]
MKNLFPYEAFLLKVKTEDNHKVIIGGFCPEGKKEETIDSYSNLSKFKLGQTKDEYLIDCFLADAIKQVSPEWTIIVGASISVAGVKSRTGGIIGNPFDKTESAQEDIEEIKKGMYLLSFPGGPGAAFTGIYADALILKEKITEYKLGNYSLKDVLGDLERISNLYILVEDGSGYGSRGGIYISDHSGMKFETFDSKI